MPTKYTDIHELPEISRIVRVGRHTTRACPFCGTYKKDRLHTKVIGIGAYIEEVYVYCGVCEAKGPPKKTKEEALQAWLSRFKVITEDKQQ